MCDYSFDFDFECSQHDGGNRDWISALPDNAFDHILSFLPLREAVKISVLSSQWRNKWAYLPTLVFDHNFSVSATTRMSSDCSAYETLLNVFYVLKFQRGPLREFALSIPQLGSFPKRIDQILQVLDSTHIESLTIGIKGYNLPSRVFSFRKLSKLRLCSCHFTSSMITFDSFALLTILELREVTLPKDVQVSFRFNCPLLEDLRMDSCGDHTNVINIVIEAPTLHYFHIVGSFSFLEFKHTPLLKKVVVHQGHGVIEDVDKLCNLFTIMDGLLAGEQLSISVYFYQNKKMNVDFSMGIGLLFQMEHVVVHPETIERSRSLIERIHVVLCRLKRVKVNQLRGTFLEMIFIRWLLETGKVLEKFEIELPASLPEYDKMSILIVLFNLPRGIEVTHQLSILLVVVYLCFLELRVYMDEAGIMVDPSLTLDRLSTLPGNVIDNILSCLSIKEAARTSCLSKHWKEKWHTVPYVVISEKMLSERMQSQIEGIVTYILTKHAGDVEMFSLSINTVKFFYDMKAWIWRLSRKSIQDLTLKVRRGSRHDVPLDLFFCEQLRSLALRYFQFRPPSSFRGFRNITSLDLKKVTISKETLESLLASCPQLETLVLKRLSCVDHLHINGSNLKYFDFGGEFKSMCFNAPVISVLAINMYRIGSEQNNFDLRFIIRGLPPAVEELSVRCPFKMFLPAGNRLAQLSTSYDNLGIFVLDEFCYKKVDEVSCLLSMSRCFPNLHTLEIQACSCDNEAAEAAVLAFWEEDKQPSCSFDQLRKARVRSFHGEDSEMRFIKFVMANSPELIELTVEATANPGYIEEVINAQLMEFPRASEKAKVNYVPYNPHPNPDDFSDDDGNSSDDSYSSDSD
ncbi:F-box/FBD/LRR-repeat protein At1g13570 [Linum perenne]